MTLLMLLVIVLVGCAVIYWAPVAKQVVVFVWAVCAILWVAGVFGVTSASIHAR